MENSLPSELHQMIQMAASDGIISNSEKELILSYAAKVGVAEELVLMQLSQFQFEEAAMEYEISDQELIRRSKQWIERLKDGSYKGLYEPFPKKIGGNDNLFDKGADALNKSIDLVKKVPGLGVPAKLGLKIATSVLAKEMDATAISFEIDRYLQIVKTRAEKDEMIQNYYDSLKSEFEEAKSAPKQKKGWFR